MTIIAALDYSTSDHYNTSISDEPGKPTAASTSAESSLGKAGDGNSDLPAERR